MGFISGLILAFTSLVVTFIQLKILVRHLPVEMVSIWLLFLTFAGYVAFLDMGINPTLSREVGFVLGQTVYSDEVKRKKITELLGGCMRIYYLLSFTILFFGTVAGLIFLKKILGATYEKYILIAWLIFIVGASIGTIGNGIFAVLYGMGDIATERLIRSGMQLIGLVGTFLVILLGYGLVGLSVVWVGQSLISRLVAGIYLYRKYPWLRNRPLKIDKNIYKKIIPASLKWASMGFGAVLILQTDKLIIGSNLELMAITKYESVAKIVMTLIAFSLIYVNTLTNQISIKYSQNNIELIKKLIGRNVRIAMSTYIVLGIFIAIHGEAIIENWLGPDIYPGNGVLWLLLMMGALEVHHSTLAAATMASGKLVFTAPALISGIINIFLAIILVNKFGLIGVALATVIAQFLTNNWYAPYITLNHYSINFRDYFKETINPLIITTFIVLGINSLLFKYIILYKSSDRLILLFIISLISGAIISYIVVLNKEEKISLKI